MANLLVLTPSSRTTRLWGLARRAALLAVAALLAALLLWPSIALVALWYVVIPLLPASFFITTAIWRGLCPLATLSEWGNGFGSPRDLTPRMVSALRISGLALFFLLVPARHLLFNQDGPVLAGAIVVILGLALIFGALFPVRSAWCNALCPVLPVELLYGQAPLLELERGRCASCNVCTPRGCLDLAGDKSVHQVLGPARRTGAWLATPHGVFFAALPGFILGYNEVTDGALARAPAVYGTILGWSLASVGVALVLVLILRLSSRVTLPLLAATSGGTYYWFTGPSVAAHLGRSQGFGMSIRALGIGLVLWWVASLRTRLNHTGILES